MILPRSHSWMHLFPGDAAYSCPAAPEWFREPFEGRGAGSQRRVLIAWERSYTDLPDLDAYYGLVAVNGRGMSDRKLHAAGFSYVRRFALVPGLRETRWFIPLEGPALSSSAFCLYTPFRLSAHLKLRLARSAIRARVPFWYRHQICIAQRARPPIEETLQGLFPDRPVRLALSSGALGPDFRRKPYAAVLGLRGEKLAFAKLSGSSIARELLEHEARILPTLSSMARLARLVPRLLFAGEVDGTYMVAQTPLEGRPVKPELTPAHRRFLELLANGKTRPAAASGLITTIRRQARELPSPRTDLLAILDDALPLLERLHVPSTITHTDFVPWNLRQHRGEIAAFDWETAEIDGLPFYDELNHIAMVAHCIKGWSGERTYDHLVEQASTAPLGLKPREVQVLQLVYFIHATLRLYTQGHGEDHPSIIWYRGVLSRLHTACARRPSGEELFVRGLHG